MPQCLCSESGCPTAGLPHDGAERELLAAVLALQATLDADVPATMSVLAALTTAQRELSLDCPALCDLIGACCAMHRAFDATSDDAPAPPAPAPSQTRVPAKQRSLATEASCAATGDGRSVLTSVSTLHRLYRESDASADALQAAVGALQVFKG